LEGSMIDFSAYGVYFFYLAMLILVYNRIL